MHKKSQFYSNKIIFIKTKIVYSILKSVHDDIRCDLVSEGALKDVCNLVGKPRAIDHKVEGSNQGSAMQAWLGPWANPFTLRSRYSVGHCAPCPQGSKWIIWKKFTVFMLLSLTCVHTNTQSVDTFSVTAFYL